jgi:glucose/arabinose dehydrogenase
MRIVSIAMLSLLACGGSASPQEEGTPPTNTNVVVREIVSGLSDPLYLTAPAGDARLFIVEKIGRIRIVKDGQLLATPFLDIRPNLTSGGERGLLSMAFHPQYAQNGFFYINYTDANGDTRIDRYRVSADADRADPASMKQILFIDQPYSNHNGGHVVFGPDGMLYIPTGDGGAGGDPQGNGQNLQSLLGKILRIDVDHGDPYAIPADNPLVNAPGAQRREVWAWGMRNPWRIAFDPSASLLYVADVGQNQWEEIDVVPASAAGLNYGWNIMEGTHCYNATSCDMANLVQPVLEYSHGDGCSVTGGFVYRGAAIPALSGHYFYADYCEGWVRSFRYANGAVTDKRTYDFAGLGNVLSFGRDAAGEMYVLSANGKVFKIAAE